MRLILLMVLLTLSIQRPVLAEAPEVELKRLQTILNTLNQELQAEYQHIRSLQEALRSNAQFPLLSQGRSPDVVAYEEVAGQERTALRREAALNAQLDVVLRSREADRSRQTADPGPVAGSDQDRPHSCAPGAAGDRPAMSRRGAAGSRRAPRCFIPRPSRPADPPAPDICHPETREAADSPRRNAPPPR